MISWHTPEPKSIRLSVTVDHIRKQPNKAFITTREPGKKGRLTTSHKRPIFIGPRKAMSEVILRCGKMRIAQNWKGKNPRSRRRANEENKGHRTGE